MGMSTRPVTPASGQRRWLTLALLGTAFFMVILDGTIVYVALPQIAADLGFSTGGVQWVMSAYLLCFGGLLLLGGRCADLLGRRRVFMVGVGLFVCSSLLCGLAWSPGGTDRGAHCPGCLSGDHGPDRTVDSADRVPRRPGTEQGARNMGRH